MEELAAVGISIGHEEEKTASLFQSSEKPAYIAWDKWEEYDIKAEQIHGEEVMRQIEKQQELNRRTFSCGVEDTSTFLL